LGYAPAVRCRSSPRCRNSRTRPDRRHRDQRRPGGEFPSRSFVAGGAAPSISRLREFEDAPRPATRRRGVVGRRAVRFARRDRARLRSGCLRHPPSLKARCTKQCSGRPRRRHRLGEIDVDVAARDDRDVHPRCQRRQSARGHRVVEDDRPVSAIAPTAAVMPN
jgi:hypothetical protein